MLTTEALTENSRQGINFQIPPCTGLEPWLSPNLRPGCRHAYDETPVDLVVYVRNDPVNKIDPDGRFAISWWAENGGDWWEPQQFEAEVDPSAPPSDDLPGGGVGVYNPQTIVKKVNYGYKDMVSLISKNNLSGQSEQLITCIAFRESEFNAEAKNQKSSASGLMQITRAAAIDVHPTLSAAEIDKIFAPGGKIFDADYNIATGSAYLGILMDRKNMDLSKALAAYGTGEEYAKKILDCETGLKALKPGDDPYEVLRRVH
jgi:hypothetical protein